MDVEAVVIVVAITSAAVAVLVASAVLARIRSARRR